MAELHSHTPTPAPAPHVYDPTAPGHDAEHVSKHVKGYLFVGALLVAFTVLTVFLSYVNIDAWFHGGNMVVGMIVATFKASLVAAIFMHLKGERVTIWRFLIFTGIFVCGLFFLTFLHWEDPIAGKAPAQKAVGTYVNQH
jgi:caa(3)-type oxidase subunit IV